jgi:hypothetical protein
MWLHGRVDKRLARERDHSCAPIARIRPLPTADRFCVDSAIFNEDALRMLGGCGWVAERVAAWHRRAISAGRNEAGALVEGTYATIAGTRDAILSENASGSSASPEPYRRVRRRRDDVRLVVDSPEGLVAKR